MYESHFNLQQTPFSIAPDPAFLYLSEGHQEALAHLRYGFTHGGFVLITGEVGTGKTTLLRNLVSQTPEELDVAFILNPRLTVRELLETVCDELGVVYPKSASLSVKQYIDALNRHLLATHQAGRGTVMIIDEAQNLSPAVLEQIRLLTNLETDKRKLLRIILLGQPELTDLLARNELRQLAQRITARYHLAALSREDTYAYVLHRLTRAGGKAHLFSRGALRRLYRISRGIPRVINLVADRALLGAYVEGRHRVTARIVERAADEVLGRRLQLRRWLTVGVVAATATGVASAYFLLPAPWPAEAPPASEHATRTAPAEPAPAPKQTLRSAERTPATTLDSADDSPLPEPSLAAPSPARSVKPPSTVQPPPAPAAAGGEPASAPAAVAVAPADVAQVPVDPPGPAAEPRGAGRMADPAPARQPLTPPDMPAFQSQRLAYQAVFERWGANLDDWTDETIPCNFAPTAGLQCLSRTGSWSDVRRLNLPVVLELWGQGSAPYYGAIVAADDDTFVMNLGGSRYRVTPADLRDAWFGSFVVLWQMPPDYHGTLKRGDRHPSVRWLRSQLGTLGEETRTGADANLFDASLQDAVVAFQRREQLLADGIVGPATWIKLGERLNLPGPKLDG